MEAGWRRNYLRYKTFFLNMMTQYRERSDVKAYLEILLSLATISIFSVFALRPTVLTIAELMGQIEEKKETLELLEEKIQNLGEAQVVLDRNRQSISLLTDYAVPQSSNSDVFSRQVEGLSQKHQMPIVSFTLGGGSIKEAPVPARNPEAADENTDEIESVVSADADLMHFTVALSSDVERYQNVASLVSDFENLRTANVITNFELSSSITGGGETRRLNLIIEGDLPYLKK